MKKLDANYIKEILAEVQSNLLSAVGQDRLLLQASLQVLLMSLSAHKNTLDTEVTKESFIRAGFEIENDGNGNARVKIPGLETETSVESPQTATS